jgi:hypothetical protein
MAATAIKCHGLLQELIAAHNGFEWLIWAV